MEKESNAFDNAGLTVLIKRFIDLYRSEDSHLASFSKSCDNHLMWAHYASRYQGYCLIFKPLDGKLRQAARDMRRSVHRLTPRGIAPQMNLQLPEPFVFRDVDYSDKPAFGDAFMRFPQHVSNFSLDEPERIKLINAQERQYLEKHKKGAGSITYHALRWKSRKIAGDKAPLLFTAAQGLRGVPLVFCGLVW